MQAQNIENIGVIHRGFSTYKKNKYRNNPQWQIALDFMNFMPEIPILCDPSHICGNRENILEIAQQAFNFEYDGLMIESHCNPDKAWSDAKQQVTPERLSEIVKELVLRKSQSEDEYYLSTLRQLRDEIDETDFMIFENISQRMQISALIGELKKQHNVAIYQRERWQEIRENFESIGENLGLSKDFIKKLLDAIHQESIHQQNLILNKKTV